MPDPRIHPSAIVEDGVKIGADTSIWDGVHVRHGAEIGRSCIVGEKSYLAYGVRVGDLVKINSHVYLCHGVTIEDGVMISAGVVFTNDRAPRATDRDITALLSSDPGPETEATTVERGATIGANATIGPGLRLGAYAMVGMGAVVTRNVPAHGLVVGNPARLIGLVARDGTRVLTIGRGDDLPDRARVPCPGDGVLLVEHGKVRHLPDDN